MGVGSRSQQEAPWVLLVFQLIKMADSRPQGRSVNCRSRCMGAAGTFYLEQSRSAANPRGSSFPEATRELKLSCLVTFSEGLSFPLIGLCELYQWKSDLHKVPGFTNDIPGQPAFPHLPCGPGRRRKMGHLGAGRWYLPEPI